MCIIMATDGTPIPEQHLANGWVNNPDGGGYMFIDHEGRLQVVKGVLDFDEWLDKYDKDWEEYGTTSPFVVHFRIGTRGPNNAANTHPHVVNRSLALAHNGIIPGLRYKKHDKRSDTRVFIDNTLRLLPRRWVDNPAIRDLIEERIGSDKIVLLSADSNEPLYILNENHGLWSGGIWYSNMSFSDHYGWHKQSWGTAKGKGKVTGKVNGASTAKSPTKSPTTVTSVTPLRGSDPDAPFDSPNSGQLHRMMLGLYGDAPDAPDEDCWEDYAFHAEDVNIPCDLCGDVILANDSPWCWNCLWCVLCDSAVETYCTCESYREYIGWDDWGEDYIACLEEEEPGSWKHTPRLHDMTDEEVEVATE